MKTKQQIEDRIKEEEDIAAELMDLDSWEEEDEKQYYVCRSIAKALEWVLKDE